MEEHRIGRFAVSLPESFTLLSASFEHRFAKVDTVGLPQGDDHAKAVDAVVKARLAEISKLNPPEADWVDGIVIEQRRLQAGQHAVIAVCYWGDSIDPESISWDAFFDYGSSGLWVSVAGYYLYDDPDAEGVSDEMDFPRLERFKEKLVADFMEIGMAYRPEVGTGRDGEQNWFYLQHGAIALPYLEQEDARVRFEDKERGLRFQIETESVDEVEEAGLMDRLGALVTSGYASGFGVSVDKIRTGKRKVAGLKGEEAIFRMEDSEREEVTFSWEFSGKEDSGDSPSILVTIETENRDIKEKTELWDAVLDSMRPTGR